MWFLSRRYLVPILCPLRGFCTTSNRLHFFVHKSLKVALSSLCVANMSGGAPMPGRAGGGTSTMLLMVFATRPFLSVRMQSAPFIMPCRYPIQGWCAGLEYHRFHDSPKTLLIWMFTLSLRPFRIEVGIDEQYYVDSSLNLVVYQWI